MHEACEIVKKLEFERNPCKIDIKWNVIKIPGKDQYSIVFDVKDGQTIESAAWVRYGTKDTVHHELDWDEIPHGVYEIFAISTDGCVYHNPKYEHNLKQSAAGGDIKIGRASCRERG